ncbi:uncharacterized protein ARMOST_22387 [Armillaria ostoyae]|uniref:Uncharacterized protein n=1 Tax=Armillaria ostoyae TaxID=47428 RepID=A0A284SCQ5_ARMOS|nr:uncharacterized protein ARMOST_22387 [Armillaria ostoyae]
MTTNGSMTDMGQGAWVQEGSLEGLRRVGECERKGGDNIGTSTAHDDDDQHPIQLINGQPERASVSLKILTIRPPRPPSPPTSNIGLPRPTQLTYGPQTRASPIL